MKKKLIILGLLLISCSNNNQTNNSKDSYMSSSNVTSKESILSSIDESSSSFISNVSSSSTNEISSLEHNEDGSAKLTPPKTRIDSFSSKETIFDFTNSFPDGFSYIYGNKILNNPTFYSNGGWKITVPNSLARIGFQTPLFNSDLKIELRFYIGDINNSNNKVDKDNPFITIYGFKEDGTLVRTKKIENQSNFHNYENSKTPLNFYLNGENIDYLEVRFTSAPYKSSQCYNFGIKQIGFKTFPYPID